MLENAMGLILADHNRVDLGDITEPRALAAVPFGGRYRIVDFMLSNMVNSGITNVGIVAQTKYKSLLDHIGTGAHWDLDRMQQGLHILPPYVTSGYFKGESGDLSGLYDFLLRAKEEHVIISDSNFVCNTDLDEIVRFHAEHKADMTITYNRDGKQYGSPVLSMELENGILKDLLVDSPDTSILRNAIGLLVIDRDLLLHLVSQSISRGENIFTIESLLRLHSEYKVRGYEFKDLVLRINSIVTYCKASLRLLETDVRNTLFNRKDYPVYTKVKNESPSQYHLNNFVSNSLISDGCEISGSVSNSLLFRGVDLAKQAKLDHCVIFQDSSIGEGADLQYVILDKNVVIRPGTRLQGQAEYPMVIRKGAVV